MAICSTTAALIPIMALHPATVILGAVIAVCTVLAPIVNVVTTATLGLLTPDHLQGRVFSMSGLLASSAEPLGLLAAGALFDLLGTATFLGFAGLLAALALVATFSKGLRQAPLATVPAPT